MSTATHLATVDDVHDCLRWLRETISGLPVEGLDWAPAPGANSITVLTLHALWSTRFWVETGSGKGPSHRRYVKEERADAFRMRGESERFLQDWITNIEVDVEVASRSGRDEHLITEYALDDEGRDDIPRTGASCLVHAASHLREHAGQIALTRDLWLARTRD
jgi:hypothetical protein